MKYEDVSPISREQALKALSGERKRTVCDALVRVAFHEPDWKWAQDHCLTLLKHSRKEVRQLAVTCLGHIARIHHRIDTGKVLRELRRLQSDPAIRGSVDDAMDDISMFVPSHPHRVARHPARHVRKGKIA